jgi:hypothetical protein
MFGGDHEGHAPRVVRPGVVRCRFTVRTHCFAVRGQALRDVFNAFGSGTNHADRLLAGLMNRLRFYAASPFIVSQAAGRSDVDGTTWPSRF